MIIGPEFRQFPYLLYPFFVLYREKKRVKCSYRSLPSSLSKLNLYSDLKIIRVLT